MTKPEPRDAYTLEEAAARCGITTKTITKEIKAGRLRSRKLGRRHMITPEAIADWLAHLPEVEPVAVSASRSRTTAAAAADR